MSKPTVSPRWVMLAYTTGHAIATAWPWSSCRTSSFTGSASRHGFAQAKSTPIIAPETLVRAVMSPSTPLTAKPRASLRLRLTHDSTRCRPMRVRPVLVRVLLQLDTDPNREGNHLLDRRKSRIRLATSRVLSTNG